MATTKATELSQLSSALQVDESTGEIIFTGSLSVDSNTLFIDADANRVGIGTLTPSTALDVAGDLSVSGDLDVDSSTLFVDSANNRVGVGTSSPDEALHVEGNIEVDRIQLYSDGNSINGRYYGGLYYDGTNQLTTFNAVRSYPNFVIGSAVKHKTNASGYVSTANNVNWRRGAFETGNFLKFASRAPVDAPIGTDVDLNTRFLIANNGDISFYEDTGTTPKFFWDASAERLGIGTSSPSDLLTIKTNTNLINGITIQDAGGTDAAVYGTNPTTGEIRIGAIRNNYFQTFYSNGTEAARIDLAGSLLVGKTSANLDTNGFEVIDNGQLVRITRSDGDAIQLNRKGSNGQIAIFRKDGSIVGSIGVDNGYLTLNGSIEFNQLPTVEGTDVVTRNKATQRINLSNQVQPFSFRKSVIALAKLENDSSIRDYFSGHIYFNRENGLRIPFIAYVAVQERFDSLQPWIYLSYTGEYNANDPDSDPALRPCTFTFNGEKYAGLEFSYSGAEHNFVVVEGETNFDVFGLDYLDFRSGTTVLNSEVNNSLNFDDFFGEGSLNHRVMPTVEGDPIVESGSNSDGDWIRFADGTQMVSDTIVIGANDGDDPVSFDMAKSFINNNYKVLNGHTNNSISNGRLEASRSMYIGRANGNESQVGARVLEPVLQSGFAAVNDYTAIGRWK